MLTLLVYLTMPICKKIQVKMHLVNKRKRLISQCKVILTRGQLIVFQEGKEKRRERKSS